MELVPFNDATHFANAIPKCPVCLLQANVYKRRIPPADLWEGQCNVCGVLRITQSAIDEISKGTERHLVCAWLARGGAAGLEVIKREHVQRALRDAPRYSAPEKLDLALRAIAEKTGHPGDRSAFSSDLHFPSIYASSSQEASYYIRELKHLGFLDETEHYPVITAKGFQRLADIQKSGRQSALAFVAMWFDPKMNSIYDEAISPAIRDAGYEPLRIDKHEHTNRIDDEIIAQIRRSRFMVAEFTGQRAGVYFESGMMLGLGRNVIWMCDRSELSAVHFDTRQYNFIDYGTSAEARQRLNNRILALEGEGPHSPAL